MEVYRKNATSRTKGGTYVTFIYWNKYGALEKQGSAMIMRTLYDAVTAYIASYR